VRTMNCTIVFWSLLNLMPFIEHAIYISVLDIQIEESEFRIEIKVFEDDLKDALRPFMLTDEFESAVQSYFDEKLSISSNDQVIELELLESRIVGDSRRISMTANLSGEIDQLEIRADYFMELFPDQQNILKLNFQGQKRYYIFKKQGEAVILKFSD